MSYSKDLRERALEYREAGHTEKETCGIFKIGTTTLKKWKRLLSETGKLEDKKRKRQPKVYPSDKLRAYIEEYPTATLAEIAKHFGGSVPGAANALEREKITLKKQHLPTVSVVKRSERNLTQK